MVFHNINVSHSGVEATQNYKGVILLTGRSEQVIKLVLYGEAADDAEKEIEVDGLSVIVDDHTPNILPDTWSIFDAVVPRAENLRAVVFECERNSLSESLKGFEQLTEHLAGSPFSKRAGP